MIVLGEKYKRIFQKAALDRKRIKRADLNKER